MLIDANKLSEAFDEEGADICADYGEEGAWGFSYKLVHDLIARAPAVDAVPVVRCKDCKHLCVWNRKDIYAFCPKTNIVFLPFEQDTRTFFCGFGERKDGGDG